MSAELVVAADVAVTERASELAQSASRYAAQSKAENTLRAYESDWRDFTRWCREFNLVELPADPKTVALYIAAQADGGRKVATISRRLAAISKAHSAAGFDSPASLRHAVVAEVWSGIRRTKGVAQSAKSAVVTDTLRAMVATLPDSLLGLRDRAILLLGFAGAFRRSELVALDVADVEELPEGLKVTLRKSKTDQEREGRVIGIQYGSVLQTCPVRSLRAWLAASGIKDGALFPAINRHGKLRQRMTSQSVALVVKRYADAAGLNPAQFAGHSLRAGLATSAAIAGVSERSIMMQTGHKSAAMVRRYIRDGSLFRENASAKVGL